MVQIISESKLWKPLCYKERNQYTTNISIVGVYDKPVTQHSFLKEKVEFLSGEERPLGKMLWAKCLWRVTFSFYLTKSFLAKRIWGTWGNGFWLPYASNSNQTILFSFPFSLYSISYSWGRGERWSWMRREERQKPKITKTQKKWWQYLRKRRDFPPTFFLQ